MKFTKSLSYFFLCTSYSLCAADSSNGLAPEVTDLNAKDVSYTVEKKIPYLKQAYISTEPKALGDGIAVGKLGTDGGDKDAIMSFAKEIEDGKHSNIDSLLIYNKGKLLFESYYKRGRVNYPHYQMSITKSYTAMALGRAIQLGHMSMDDLKKPVLNFLTEIDQSNLAPGAKHITLHDAMHMKSGIRVDKKKAAALLRQNPEKLKGQGQIQTYMELTASIDHNKKEFKYQGSDPSITIQVVEAKVPGTAKDFIKNELLAPMGINNYGWQEDTSGLPKSAAGSSWRSRDMLKMGILVLDKGKWQEKQHIPAEFVAIATSSIDTNPNRGYGYFWWTHEAKVGNKTFTCKSGRGAGGQFILMFPEIDLIIVSTAHNKGMGKMLSEAPKRIIPAFVK